MPLSPREAEVFRLDRAREHEQGNRDETVHQRGDGGNASHEPDEQTGRAKRGRTGPLRFPVRAGRDARRGLAELTGLRGDGGDVTKDLILDAGDGFVFVAATTELASDGGFRLLELGPQTVLSAFISFGASNYGLTSVG